MEILNGVDIQQDKAAKIKQAFSDLNRKFEEQGTQRLAAKMRLPYFDLTGFPIEQSTLAMLSRKQAEQGGAVPFFREGPLIRIGITDPRNQELKKLILDLEKKKYKVELYLVSKTGLAAALQQYKKIVEVSPVQKHEITISSGKGMVEKMKSLENLQERIQSVPVTDLLAWIIGAAVTMRSSDVHLEPEKTSLKVRFRVDGVLTDIVHLHPKTISSLISRIKLLSGMKLNITSMPQDGRFSVKSGQGSLDLRISLLPTAFGESVVIRILGMQQGQIDIEEMGLKGKALELARLELSKPNGMTLTTGPTGSGKTTTLYAFLNYLNKPGVKIITLEDPVEYQISGIIQTPIDHSAGMDFAKGLRSTLRQDPDIIMVGEIRDFETAETAAQAALTGHVVLSTLHTNDAAGAIPRLLDLGVKPVTLAPALNALIAQRLVRKICASCKEIYRPSRQELERVRQVLAKVPPSSGINLPERIVFYHSRGCAACHELGYKGQIGIFEVFSVDEKIEALIFKQAPAFEIKKQAQESGMTTMQQDGILKALEGLTDLAEVWRVTEE